MDSLGHSRGDGDERLVFAHAWLGSIILAVACPDRVALTTPLPAGTNG